MKTVMIGAGGDQDGFPIVGWLVPLNGQNAYQTYRLCPGLTKIGTAQPSDIVVNDGFMSTEHCQITCSPAGFTLLDNGLDQRQLRQRHRDPEARPRRQRRRSRSARPTSNSSRSTRVQACRVDRSADRGHRRGGARSCSW